MGKKFKIFFSKKNSKMSKKLMLFYYFVVCCFIVLLSFVTTLYARAKIKAMYRPHMIQKRFP